MEEIDRIETDTLGNLTPEQEKAAQEFENKVGDTVHEVMRKLIDEPVKGLTHLQRMQLAYLQVITYAKSQYKSDSQSLSPAAKEEEEKRLKQEKESV